MTPSYSTEVTNFSPDWTYSKYYLDCQYNIFWFKPKKTTLTQSGLPVFPPNIDDAAMFSPALSTLAEALQCSYLPEFAGLTLNKLQ